MLKPYRIKYQRRIGGGEWETTLTVIDIHPEDVVKNQQILFPYPIQDLYDEKGYKPNWIDIFRFYVSEKYWCDCLTGKRYSYKKYRPYIELRRVLEPTEISMSELLKLDSEKVIQYCVERGMNFMGN